MRVNTHDVEKQEQIVELYYNRLNYRFRRYPRQQIHYETQAPWREAVHHPILWNKNQDPELKADYVQNMGNLNKVLYSKVQRVKQKFKL